MTLILTIEIHVLLMRTYLTYSAIKVVYTAFTVILKRQCATLHISYTACIWIHTPALYGEGGGEW